MTLREPLDEAASTRGRVAVWFAVRALTPAAVLLAVAAAGVRPDTERLAWILTTQGAFALATHLLAAKARPAQSLVIWIGMIADVAAVGALVALTGGTAGPLVFLFTVHALAAGILLSSRAGLRSILLSTGAILVIDMIAAPAGTSGVALPSGAVAIAALWILGGTGTLFTTYNERELRRRNAELATIRRITLDIEGSLSLEEIFADLCAGVADAFRFDATAVLLRQGKHVRCVAAHGVTGAMGRTFVPSGRVAQALLCGTPTVTTTEEARADGGLEPILGESGYVAVPIAEGGLLVATRSGRQGGPGRVRESEIEALEGLAHHARLAVANARLHQRVATMAVTDPLTGLWNHGEMQRRLADEAGRLGRYTALRGSDHALSFKIGRAHV